MPQICNKKFIACNYSNISIYYQNTINHSKITIMDPRLNPYSPGAGNPPPEFSGREKIIEQADIALDRIKAGRPTRGFILYGLRGVGKTVLLNKIALEAESKNLYVVRIESPEDRSLPAILVPTLRSTLLKISKGEALKNKLAKSMRAIAGFANSLKIKYNDIEIGLNIDKESGVADSGDLELDLIDLLCVIGEAAAENNTAIIINIDELQYIPEEQLAALITALHRASQKQLPIIMIAAGLPQLLGQMGSAKSYAERLFEFIPVDKLDNDAAKNALCKPAQQENVFYDDAAIKEILLQTQSYPYFLQEWGKHCWNIATNSPITKKDATIATQTALAELDASFFRVRFDRLTPTEKQYVRAMAEIGAGPHRSGDIANILNKAVSTTAPTRSSLIRKGMIFSPNHGDTAFTVPLFDGFMKRIMPVFGG